MIVSEEKQLGEIIEMLKPYKRIGVIGCSGCYGIGMIKNVENLSARLKENGINVTTYGSTGRQCSWFWEKEEMQDEDSFVFGNVKGLNRDALKDADALLSLACGVGAQTLAKATSKPVVPGANTKFMGRKEELMFYEQCLGCGNCILHLTGGICPIAKCPKSHMNGPCGGVYNGKCEVGRENECVWIVIYSKLKSLGQLEKMKQRKSPKDFSVRTHPRVSFSK